MKEIIIKLDKKQFSFLSRRLRAWEKYTDKELSGSGIKNIVVPVSSSTTDLVFILK